MPALDNPRHEYFAQELAKGVGQTEAYVNAGYKRNPSAATRLASDVKICERVREILERASVRSEISIARVLEELGRIGFSDIRDAFGEDGSLKHASKWSDDFAPAVAALEVVERDGEAGEREYVHKFKMWDKNAALEKLAKHLGMYIERVEMSGPNGGPIATADVSPDRLVQALGELSQEQRDALRPLLEKFDG